MDTVLEGLLDLPRDLLSGSGLRCGRLVTVTDDGTPLVEFPGCPGGRVAARALSSSLRGADLRGGEEIPVLLGFERNDPGLPIILGMLEERVCREEATSVAGTALEVTLDGRTTVLEAKEELVLKCGRSSVSLRKDGKVIIRGAHLVSRSSGANKIRGASVAIN